MNLLDRVLEVHREPQPGADAQEDGRYRALDSLPPPVHVTPLAAPHARILVGHLLP